MKKLVLLIFTVCMGGGIAASAQEVSQQKLDSLNQALSDISARVKETEAAESNRAIWKDRSKYFNLNYVNQKLSPDIDGWDKLGGGELKSDFGAAIVWGKTYYLHKKPLAGMIKFGIDWSWMDLNYAQYKLETYDYDTDELYSEKAHQLEYGMQIGPSVTINPVHHLKVSAYFRVTQRRVLPPLCDLLQHGFRRSLEGTLGRLRMALGQSVVRRSGSQPRRSGRRLLRRRFQRRHPLGGRRADRLAGFEAQNQIVPRLFQFPFLNGHRQPETSRQISGNEIHPCRVLRQG